MDGTYWIEINGSDFSMNVWSGTWSPNTLEASGQSTRNPITVGQCIVDVYSEVKIAFVSDNVFTGTITHHTHYNCVVLIPSCESAWRITGARK